MARYALSKDALAKIADAEVALSAAIDAVRESLDESRERYDNATERWLESDRGEAVGEWLERVETMADAMETLKGEHLDDTSETEEAGW